MTIQIPALKWPVGNDYPITQQFGENPDAYDAFGLPGHNGVDFGCPAGTEVLAANSGSASMGFDPRGYGYWVKITHPDGYETLYAHLSAVQIMKSNKISGIPINALGIIGYSGGIPGAPGAGHTTGAHLHFELSLLPPNPIMIGYKSGARDPMPYMEAIEPNAELITPDTVYKPRDTVIVTALAGANMRVHPNPEKSFVVGIANCDSVWDVVEDANPHFVKVTGEFYLSKSWVKTLRLE